MRANRDYKTRDRSARARIEVLEKRIKELMERDGWSREVASKYAYSEILKGKMSKRIKAKIKELQ